MPVSTFVRPIIAGVAVALAATGLVACDPSAAQVWGPADCAPAVPTYPAPCGSLGMKLRSLRAGDVLRIQPGTYKIGKMRVDNLTGAPGSGVIKVMADDPSDRPTLDGWLSLWWADYVVLDSLRFHGTETTSNGGGPAGGASFTCGIGWTVKNSDLYGANATQAKWNLSIGGTKNDGAQSDCPNEPRDFTITQNVFRLPYTNGTSETIYHHIYAFFEGDTGTGGTISRNIFHGFRNGAGIKLGASSTNCARNVWIQFNTFYDGARALVMEDDVRGIVINGNLTDQIRGGGGYSGPHLAVALGNVVAASPANVISHTYAANNANPLHLVWGPVLNGLPGVLTDGGDNPYRAGSDPVWNSVDPTAAGAFSPANNAAKPYGRYGTGNFP